MPFNDRDVSASGRDSRASDFSRQSDGRPRKSGQSGIDMFSSAAVLSMLRTTTDMGDIGNLSVNQNRLPALPRPTHRRRTNPAHLSDSSQQRYAPSQMSNRSSRNQHWDTSSVGRTSMGRRGSISSLQTTKTGPPYYSEPPFAPGAPKSSRHVPYAPSPAPSSQDSRSYSLTGPLHHSLTMQRSASSLRSQSTAPPMPPRGPYMYPGRFKRPSYRAASPALSDYSAGPTPPLPTQGRHIHRPPLMSYHSDYANGPMMVPRHYPPPMPPMPPMHPYHPQTHQPPPMAYDYYGQPYAMHPQRRAPHYSVPHHGAPHFPAMPPRAYTPRVESTPPSSGPSSSAAQSSDPPTPRDAHTAQLTIEPAFIDPATSDLGDEADNIGVYAQYADQLKVPGAFELDAESAAVHELEATEQAEDAQPPAGTQLVRQDGFVQRIKTLLNERAAGEVGKVRPQLESGRRSESTQRVPSPGQISELPASPIKVLRRRSTMKNIAEAKNLLKSRPSVRITKDMVRSIMSPSSSSEQGSVTIDIKQDDGHIGEIRIQTSADQTSSALPSEEGSITSKEPQTIRIAIGGRPETTQTYEVHDIETETTSDDEQFDTIKTEDLKMTAKRGTVTSLDLQPVSPMKPGEEVFNDSIVSRDVDDSLVTPTPKLEPTDRVVVRTASKKVKHSTRLSEISLGPKSEDPPAPIVVPVTENNSTSTVVSDIAVRFSLPRSNDQVKPQLVRVQANTDTQKSSDEDVPGTAIVLLPKENTFVSAATNADNPTSLNVKKSEESIGKHLGSEGADLSSFIRRSFPRRQSIWSGDLGGSRRSSIDATNESRASGMRNALGGLPKVKEDSQEDIPSASFRSSDFKFPIPKALLANLNQEPLNPLGSHPTQPNWPSNRPGMSLSELQSLPSLNFSRMDLVDQLNAALDTRSSRSFDVFRRQKASEIVSPSPIRPASTEALRERYTSFFAKPEEFHVPVPVEETQGFSAEDLLSGGQSEHPKQPIEVVEEQAPQRGGSRTSKRVMSPVSRPLSPEDLLGVASDAQRLSVPSMARLSERLTQILPSLKHLHLDSIIANDEQVENTIEEIHHIGERPKSLCTIHSSIGLRSLAAVAEDIATNGTHDSSMMSVQARRHRNFSSLSRPGDQTFEATSPADGSLHDIEESPTSSGSQTTPKRLTPRRTMSEGRVSDTLLKIPAPALTTHSKRSLTVSGQTTRPWNNDDNYPWSNDTIDIDIGLPPQAHCRESITSDLLRHTARASQGTITGIDQTLSSILSSVSELDPTATVTADTLTNTNHLLKANGKLRKAPSLLGSLRKSSRLRTRPSVEQDLSYTDTTLSPSRAHNPGDRYPSTALDTLNFNLDEVRSFFSDDSDGNHIQEGRKRRASLRKHLSSLRLRLPPVITISRPQSDIEAEARSLALRTQSLDRRTGSGTGRTSGLRVSTSANGIHTDGTESLPTPMTSSTGFEGLDMSGGMGKVEFRVKKVTERLKMMWARGGELLRSLSGRNRKRGRRTVENDGSEDGVEWGESIYSGT